MKLHHRIVVPFALIALIATAATAYAALLVTFRALRAHATFPRVSALATYGSRYGSASALHRANTATCDETNDR